jgi:hypothetical protein
MMTTGMGDEAGVRGGDGGVSRCSSAPSVSRVVGRESGSAGESPTACRDSHPLYIALCDGAHQPWIGWAPPTSRVKIEPDSALGRVSVEDPTNRLCASRGCTA